MHSRGSENVDFTTSTATAPQPPPPIQQEVTHLLMHSRGSYHMYFIISTASSSQRLPLILQAVTTYDVLILMLSISPTMIFHSITMFPSVFALNSTMYLSIDSVMMTSFPFELKRGRGREVVFTCFSLCSSLVSDDVTHER